MCQEVLPRFIPVSSLYSQGEGVAYRGRLLVELQSKLGEEIDKELEEIRPDELIRVQVSI